MPYKSKADRQACQLRRSQANRAELIKMLGGKCIVCGSEEDLEFHHKDQTTKSFTIGAALRGSREERIAEAKKCELRCRDHHLDCHAAPHGSTNKRCKCNLCLEARRTYNANWMKDWRAAGKDKSRVR